MKVAEISEYVIHAKLKNNLLLSRILAEAKTVAEFCQKYSLDQSQVGDLINLKAKAITKLGWRKLAIDLAEVFGCDPEDLFTQEQAAISLKCNQAYISMSNDQAMAMIESAVNPVLALEDKETIAVVHEILGSLSDRERTIIEARMNDKTYDEIGSEHNPPVSSARIRQIEDKALRKLRHPSRGKRLRHLLPEYADPNDIKAPRNVDGWSISNDPRPIPDEEEA